MPGRSRRLKRVGVGRRAFVGLLSLGAMVALSPSAQALHWVPTGPRGGGVSSLATVEGDGGALWAAAEGAGLWRSVDAGVSWQPVPTPQSSTAFGVVTDPSDPRVLYSEGTGGVAKTLDGGASWKVVSSVSVGGFAIAPSAPATLYLASQRVNVGQDSTFSRSDDGGATWRPLALLPPQPPGVSWSVYEVDVDPADPNHVFAPASSVGIDGSPALLRSTDGGSSWTSIDLEILGGFNGHLSKITFDRSGSGILYGLIPQGAVRSHDQGSTWEHASAGLPADGGFTDLVLDPASGALLLAASGSFDRPVGQIWRSTDGGSSWTKVLERSAPIQPLALDHAHPGRLYAGAQDVGLLVSTDSGQHWQVANPGFLPMSSASNLIADLRAPGTLYAQVSPQFGPHLTPSFPPLQFARTQDGGATWETWMPRNDDGTDFSFGANLIADPFAAGSLYSTYFSEFFSQSVDGGRTWHTNGRLPAGFSGIFEMIADPFRAGGLLVISKSGSSGDVVLRSADAGKSWTKVLNLGTGTRFIEGLFADPAPPGALYAGGQGGFWRSLNGGRTWTFRSLGRAARGQTVFRLQTDSSHNLYVQTAGGPGQHSLYRGTGQGGTFMPIDGGLPAGLVVTDLAAGPQQSSLYLGSVDGVYVSRDRGTHWAAAKEGLISLFINHLVVEPAGGGTVYAATPGGLAILQQP